ncbi:MAG: leucine-rich repeat domain-containing protein [Bacteroidia bacterium]|nr:leucine-rich repeat domain-containing protein [Bacteroidia bacterium]
MKQLTGVTGAILCLMLPLSLLAQGTPDPVTRYKEEARQMVDYLAFTLNTLGSPYTTPRQKETIIFESYRKIFEDDQVQIEDDLVEGRSTATLKDVQAYLKDISYFFKEVNFAFDIQEITHEVSDSGSLYLKVQALRTLTGEFSTGGTISNTQPRTFEINVFPAQNRLYIASIYTQGIDQDESLLAWWASLDQPWRRWMASRIVLADTVTLASLLDTYPQVMPGDTLVRQYKEYLIIDDSITLRLAALMNHPRATLGDTLEIGYEDTYIWRREQALRQIRECFRLQVLDLSGHQDLVDMSPLARFSQLRELSLAGIPLQDITPLRNLTRLEQLNLTATRVDDLTPLRYATMLRTLRADSTQVQQLEVLRYCTRLEQLYLRHTPVQSLAPLEAHPALTALYLDHTYQTTFDSLTRMPSLRTLSLSHTPVVPASHIRLFEGIQTLDLAHTPLTSRDLSALSALPALQTLHLDHTAVADLTPLLAAPRLRRIYCDGTTITQAHATWFMSQKPACLVVFESDLLRSWWQHLPEAWTRVFKQIVPLSSPPTREELHTLISVNHLDITGNTALTSLEPLRLFTRLEQLTASNTLFTDITPLQDIETLEILDLTATPVADLSALQFLPRLHTLRVSQSRVSDLSPLRHTRSLRTLWADNTAISDLTPLRQAHGLQRVYADQTGVTPARASLLLDSLPGVLICFQSVALESWWQNLSPSWQEALLRQSGMTAPPDTREAYHGLVSMQELVITHNPDIQDLRPLMTFLQLRKLILSSTGIRSLVPLSSLTRLRTLDLSNNAIPDLSPLASLVALRELSLAGIPLQRLDAITTLTQIERLDIRGTPVRSLSPLMGFARLSHLDCAGTSVSSLAPVAALPLVSLTCFNTRISPARIQAFRLAHPACQVTYY